MRRQAAAVVRSQIGTPTKNVDLAPDRKGVVAFMNATEAKRAQEAQNRGAFPENFLEELRRKVPVEK